MPTASTTLPFDLHHLPQDFPRRFVPTTMDWEDRAQVLALFRRLEEAPLDTAAQVDTWLEQRAELGSCLSQEGTLRSLRTAVNTADVAAQQALTAWRETVAPVLQEASHRLDQKLADSPGWALVDEERYGVVKRGLTNRMALFRQANIALNVEAGRWGQEYQQCVGSLSVTFRGAPHTPQQLAKYLEEPDRASREEAWRASSRRYLQERDRFDDWLDRLVANRHQQAKNAGFEDYRAFSFRARERFDYTPEDCVGFHEGVERHVGPVARRLAAHRARALHVETIRPWDTQVDPAGPSPLQPFTTAEALEEGAARVFQRMDPDLAGYFDLMRRYRLLDVANRPHKRPGAFLSTLEEVRLPFLFMNAVGRASDVVTLFHECGHAFHGFLHRHASPVTSRGYPMEIAEVASMSMELLSMPFWNEWYPSPEDRRRAEASQWRHVVSLFPAVALIDAFQHWLYTHPGHSRQERAAQWIAGYRRFMPDQDVSGLEELLLARLYAIPHVFLYPFYYIEYGIAQLGALQLWRRSRKDFAAALHSYKYGLSLGYAKPLPRLYEALGIRLAFGEEMFRTCLGEVTAELEGLDLV